MQYAIRKPTHQVHDRLIKRMESRIRPGRSSLLREEVWIGVEIPRGFTCPSEMFYFLSDMADLYRAMSRLLLMPFRPLVVLGAMRSILLMMLIHGISRFTIADMAESTPL